MSKDDDALRAEVESKVPNMQNHRRPSGQEAKKGDEVMAHVANCRCHVDSGADRKMCESVHGQFYKPEYAHGHPYTDPRCLPGLLRDERMCAQARSEVPNLMKTEMERTGQSAEDALLIAMEATRAEVERLSKEAGK